MFFQPSDSQAEESPALYTIFTSCFLGASIGAAAGSLTAIFSKHPEDRMDRIGQGAGIGCACGLINGIYVVSVPWYSTNNNSHEKERVYGLSVMFPINKGIPRKYNWSRQK